MTTQGKLMTTIAVIWAAGLVVIFLVFNTEGMKVREDPPEGYRYGVDDPVQLDLVIDKPALLAALALFTLGCVVVGFVAYLWTQPKRP